VFIVRATKLPDRLDVVSDVLALSERCWPSDSPPFALVVSIPSERYFRLLAETPNGGTIRFLDPFLIAVGTQAPLILAAFGYKLGATQVSRPVEHAVFYVVGFLFVFGLLDVVALARSLVRHGVNRGVEAANAGLDEAATTVQHLDQRRKGALRA
jgi:hypothetical protein